MHILPKPTGPYTIGTTFQKVVDASRKEQFAKGNAPRELLIQLLYPAQKINDGAFLPYAHDVMQEWVIRLKHAGFPEKHIKELKNQKTFTLANPQLLSDAAPYPVIIFSHAYTALCSAYTAFYEELASQGYIVVAISHTYYCMLTTFPDEKSIPAAPQNITQENLLSEESSQKQQETWLDDVKAVLAHLEKLNNTRASNNSFYHALDLDNIGIIGHSFGGSTALQMCRIDARIKAGINLDGALFGSKPTQPINKPIMIIVAKKTYDSYKMRSDEVIAQETGFPRALIKQLRKKYFEDIPKLFEVSPNAYLTTIDNAKHAAFSDWVLLKNLPLYSDNKHIFDIEKETGQIDGPLVISIINAYVIRFFDRYLKGKSTELAKPIHEIVSVSINES